MSGNGSLPVLEYRYAPFGMEAYHVDEDVVRKNLKLQP